MIGHTKAYETYRGQSQAHLDFYVLVATAVPNLERILHDSASQLAPAHYFKTAHQDKRRLIGLAARYEKEIAALSVVALYSYFEAYVKSTIQEVIDFHGGAYSFARRATSRASRFLDSVDASLFLHKRKLQEYPKSGKSQKYRKHSSSLGEMGFRFPSELLAPYGVALLISKADEKRGLRAWEIPTVLQSGLLLQLSKSEADRLENVRTLRNEIAHGKKVRIRTRGAMAIAKDLHAIAARIDRHVVEHFLVLEEFAR